MKSSSSVGPRRPAFSEFWLSATGTPWLVVSARPVESTRTRSSERASGFCADRRRRRCRSSRSRSTSVTVLAPTIGSAGLTDAPAGGATRGLRIVFARLVGIERKRGGEIGGRRDLLGEDIACSPVPRLGGAADGRAAAAHVALGRLLVAACTGRAQHVPCQPIDARRARVSATSSCGQALRPVRATALARQQRGADARARPPALRSAAWRAPRRCGRPAASGPGGTRSRPGARRRDRTGSRRGRRTTAAGRGGTKVTLRLVSQTPVDLACPASRGASRRTATRRRARAAGSSSGAAAWTSASRRGEFDSSTSAMRIARSAARRSCLAAGRRTSTAARPRPRCRASAPARGSRSSSSTRLRDQVVARW